MISDVMARLGARFMMGLFFSLVVISGSAVSEETAIVTARPALWQVEQGDKKTYLLGSFHLLPKNYRWYEGIIQKSFEAADELVLETDISAAGTAQIQGLVIKNAFFGQGDNLKNHLDARHYQMMLGYASKVMGLKEAAAIKSKPWFMAVQLSVVSVMSSGMDPESGVDKYLQNLALKDGKIISGLETPTEQMMALIDHPLKVQSEMLTDTLDKLGNFKVYMDSYIAAWASGDADRLNKTMVQDMASQPEMYQALLVDRNHNWLPKIESYIQNKKTTFIVVGAAHLVGPDGIVKLLRSRGYKVKKIQ